MVKDHYETSTVFQSWSDAERQEKYEYDLMSWTIIIYKFLALNEKNDAASKKEIKKTAEAVFKDNTGFPISRVRLTADGMTVD